MSNIEIQKKVIECISSALESLIEKEYDAVTSDLKLAAHYSKQLEAIK